MATHLFRNYIRRGLVATRREFAMSLLSILLGGFCIYMLTEDAVWSISFFAIICIQLMAIAFPWFGGLIVFGYLFGQRFGYEPLRDVDMMASARTGAYAGGAAAGVLALLRLTDQLWGG
jgi:hypothetical protein